MSDVAAYHLRSAAARLLLAGKGGGTVLSYLPQQPAGRQEAIDLVAELVRQGVVTNTGTALHIEQPLDGWLQALAAARRVVRLVCAAAPRTDCCLYPAPNSTTVLCMPRLGHRGQLRITAAPDDELWPLLCESTPLLALPHAPGGAPLDLPELPKELPTLEAAPEELPGFLLGMQLYRNGHPERTAFAVRHGPDIALAVTGPDGGPPTVAAYCGEALYALLRQWLKGESES